MDVIDHVWPLAAIFFANPRTAPCQIMASWNDAETKEKYYFYYYRGKIVIKNPGEMRFGK